MSNKVSTYLKVGIDATETKIAIGDYDYQQIFSAGTGSIYLILRGPTAREIVKVDIQASLWGTYLAIARGQGGSIAAAWPQGTKIWASTHADLYNSFVQEGEVRTIDYNPNEILSPLFAGEKVYQDSPAGCERWWKAYNGIDPYWDIITGLPCGIEAYVDIGWDYDILKPQVLELIFLDADFQAGGSYLDIYFDGTFVYTACMGSGIRSHSVDGSGIITYLDVHDQGGTYYKIWGDGTFIYAASSGVGLVSYSVDGSGNITFIDVDVQVGDDYRDVWGDGNFIYTACDTDGLRSHSVDGSGIITFIDEIVQGTYTYGVWGDGNFIYTACADGIRSFSVDGSGNLTFVDFLGGYGGKYKLWGDGNFIYAAGYNNGITVYSVDGSGNLSYVDGDYQGTAEYYEKIWGDGNFIYVAGGELGLLRYSVDGSGILTFIDLDYEPVGYYLGVHGGNGLIYVATSWEGMKTYELG